MTDISENKLWMENENTANQRIEQANALKMQASTGGLSFETYLTPDLAVWVLDMVEQGIFIDPSEAVFVLMGQAKDIESHEDLKRGLLKRRLEESIEQAENGQSYTPEEVKQHMKDVIKNRTEPAVWQKISQQQK